MEQDCNIFNKSANNFFWVPGGDKLKFLGLSYQNILNAFKNKLLRACGSFPKNFSFSRKCFLLQRVIDVQRMLCPTVDEGKGEFSADVELALQDGVHAGDVPVFIMTVIWQNNASTEKWLCGN